MTQREGHKMNFITLLSYTHTHTHNLQAINKEYYSWKVSEKQIERSHLQMSALSPERECRAGSKVTLPL